MAPKWAKLQNTGRAIFSDLLLNITRSLKIISLRKSNQEKYMLVALCGPVFSSIVAPGNFSRE